MISDIFLKHHGFSNKMVTLVADDDEKIIDLFSKFFKMKKMEGYFAEDADQALSLFKQHHEKITTLIIDLSIEGENTSISTIKACKKLKPDLHIIAMTGGLIDNYMDDLQNLGVKAFIQKPFSFKQVIDQIV